MAKITRTTNPLPFEVLEPHKFEDVVRGLLYDFRDWQSIEATGKKGSDDGFDSRAWEKVKVIENEAEEKEEESESVGEHPMQGNLWMIQCKREKEITPKEVEKILEDVDPKNPPYGYILAAACDFSKKSQDTFRETLLKKGVTEFYMWGKSYLEDMLYLPKNDHILFTAFGISLNTRRRSRKTEIKFALNNKNKVFRIWGGPQAQHLEHKPVLFRDFDDENYPFEGEYKDFDKNPRWFEYMPFIYHPLGLWVHSREFYGYIDEEKKEYDVFSKVDLLNRQSDRRLEKESKEERELKEKVSEYWERFPSKNQARFSVDGLVYFKDMLIIDDKGDHLYDFPHIFVEFNKKTKRPFSGYRYNFKTNNGEQTLTDDFKQVEIFPKKFIKQKLGKVYKKKLDIPYNSIGLYGGNISHNGFIFSIDDKYSFLNKGEIVILEDDSESGSSLGDRYLEITQIYETTVKKFAEENNGHPFRRYMSEQLKKDVVDEDKITVFEVRSVPSWNFKGKTS